MGMIPEISPERWRKFLRKAAGAKITRIFFERGSDKN